MCSCGAASVPVILLPCSLIPQRGFGGKILCPPLRAAARVRFARAKSARPLHPCSLRAPYFSAAAPPAGGCGPGLSLPSLRAAPGGPSAAPAAVGGGSGFVLFVQCWGVHHGWFRFCPVFSRRGRSRPTVVLRLGVGSPGFARRRWLVAGAGLPVRAVRLFRHGGRLRARCFGAGLAGVAAARRFRLSGLVRLRLAGPRFRGQGSFAFRAFLPRRLRGLAANAGAVFAGGFGCLGCLAWSRWPVRGRCLRPAPPWWSGWRRFWPAPALPSRSAAAAERMRRCCPPCPVPCRRPCCAVSRLSVLLAKAPARFRRPRACRPSRPRAAASSGGRAARLRSRCAPGWPAARERWSARPMPAWWRSSARPARADRCSLAATHSRGACR
jgi:hypothetical protein